MKVVMISNFFNHHQKPLSDALFGLAEDYLFVATSEMPEERLKLGYADQAEEYVFKVCTEQDKSYAMKKINEADVAIIGSAPEEYIQGRLNRNKLTFRYSERPFKTFHEYWKAPIRFVKWRKRNPVRKPLYLLCASAFAAGDFAKFGLFKGKTFRWGYFPETKRTNDLDALIDGKKKNSLLWVGRFIDWKHPETAVEVAGMLRDKGYDFTLDMIGNGEALPRIQEMIHDRHLEEHVHLPGSLPYREVREHMEQSEVFLVTSSAREGWGAVLNEAMNSACAVAAADRIGSVPYLLENGVNGFTYTSQNPDSLFERVAYYLTHEAQRKEISAQAYRTIIDTWNAETAAKRLIALSEALIAGKDGQNLFDSGPCSTAPRLKDH